MRISAAALGSLGGSLPSCGRKFRWRDTRARSFFSSCRRRLECNHAPAARHEHDDAAQHQIDSHELAALRALRAAHLPVLCRLRLFQTSKRREIDVPEEQHHQYAHALHDVHIDRRARHATEEREQHAVTREQQGHHRRPYPGKEIDAHAHPQAKPQRRLQHIHSRGPQRHVRKKHPPHPHHGGEQVEHKRTRHIDSPEIHQRRAAYPFDGGPGNRRPRLASATNSRRVPTKHRRARRNHAAGRRRFAARMPRVLRACTNNRGIAWIRIFGVHLAIREAIRVIVRHTTSDRTYTNNRETHMTRHRDAELGQFIPLHYHYNMLNDTARMHGFKAAIDHAVHPGARVLELGGGTGVLSYFAAQKASKVWCVERNPELAHTARAILALNRNGHRVEENKADAFDYLPPEPVDVVICEMIHVAMLREKQIPVISAFKQRYLEKFGGPLPRGIPEALIQAVQPVEQSFEFEGYFAPTILFQDPAAMQPKTRELAAPAVYQLLSYEHELPRHCTSNGTIRIAQAGSLNAK